MQKSNRHDDDGSRQLYQSRKSEMGKHVAPSIRGPSSCTSGSDAEVLDEDEHHPLQGAHFGPLKGPGPSGTCPEHISEILGVKRRNIASKALRAFGKLMDVMERGDLTEQARLITFSRTIFLRKKAGPEPRPVKIGEFLRTAVAKRTVAKHAHKLHPTLVKMRQ